MQQTYELVKFILIKMLSHNAFDPKDHISLIKSLSNLNAAFEDELPKNDREGATVFFANLKMFVMKQVQPVYIFKMLNPDRTQTDDERNKNLSMIINLLENTPKLNKHDEVTT